MTADHVSWEMLGDYSAGLLFADEQASVAQHLTSCPDCSAAAARIREVQTTLSTGGKQPLRMPSAVWLRIESALEQELSLNRRSPGRNPPSPARRRPSGVVLSAAAAALAVAGAGVALQHAVQSSSHAATAASTAASAAAKARGAQPADRRAAASDGRLTIRSAAPALTPATLPLYARSIGRGGRPAKRSASTVTGQRSSPTSCALPDTSASTVVSAVRWRGVPAVVVVRRSTRQVQVLDCRTAARVLYATSY